MQIGLVSLHSPEYSQLAQLTWHENKLLYCTVHGYLSLNEVLPFDPKMCFGKFRQAKQLFDAGADYVWATGCDSLITNFTKTIEEIVSEHSAASFLITTDRNGINADSFIIKNDKIGNAMINWMALVGGAVYSDEQAAINAYIGSSVPGSMQILPQRAINSYNYNLYPSPEARFDKLGTDGQWRPGDLLIHWPGFADNPEMRIGWAHEYKKMIIA